MDGLSICAELWATSKSVHWETMFILYCRRSMVEDYESARQINRMAAEVNNINIQRERFIEELETLGTRYVLGKMAEFLREIQRKDDEMVMDFALAFSGSPVSVIAGVIIVTSLVLNVGAGGRRTLKLDLKSSNKAEGRPLVKICILIAGGHMENSNLTSSNQVTNKIQELQRTMESVALEEGCVAMQS
nr:hypothetical protein [Tanacetum cinerariifolium]